MPRLLFLLRTFGAVALIAALAPMRSVVAAPLHICAHAIVAMPAASAHRVWLERNRRYGPDEAASFAERVRRTGPGILRTQIVVLERWGLSAWIDITSLSGLREARWVRQVKKFACYGDSEYPIVVLIGFEALSISGDALVVAGSPGTYQVISISGHEEGTPFAVRLGSGRKAICDDIRECENLATHPLLRR